MRETFAHVLLTRKSLLALEARAARTIAELRLDRPWTRSAPLWIDVLVTIAESDR